MGGGHASHFTRYLQGTWKKITRCVYTQN